MRFFFSFILIAIFTINSQSAIKKEVVEYNHGDVVLKVNGDSIVHIKSTADALVILFGKIGEKVALTVTRGEQILTFEIAREPSAK